MYSSGSFVVNVIYNFVQYVRTAGFQSTVAIRIRLGVSFRWIQHQPFGPKQGHQVMTNRTLPRHVVSLSLCILFIPNLPTKLLQNYVHTLHFSAQKAEQKQ